MSVSALITAEHASCEVPREWAPLFRGHESVVRSHRGWDPGTSELAAHMAEALAAPLLRAQVSRLLVDLNRSCGNPGHFSEFTRSLPQADKARLVRQYWEPHWSAYRAQVENSRAPVVHIACHSFTPVLNGQTRQADIGLLYDPSRTGERAFCAALAAEIRRQRPYLRVRMNYPYRGTSNGLGQQHRRLFEQDRLLTLELEVNSALTLAPDWAQLQDALILACRAAIRSA